MSYLNVEIKARCTDAHPLREYLKSQQAECRGTDHQTDTYFNSPNGRLKLREGNIENNLIFYERADQAGPKQSFFKLVKIPDAAALKDVLTASMGVKVVVSKKREIWYIRNVKFHIDVVEGLGAFMEIEAGNLLAPELSQPELQAQCDQYMKAMGIREADLLQVSYSDLLLCK
jgi:adenylate cyclase, class 2